MSNYYLYHISFFDSLLKGLKSNGVNLDSLTQQSYIRRFDLENPDTYLPIEVAYELFQKVKESQGIDNISGEFYGGFQVADLSEYGEFLSGCPDLHSILLNGIRYDYLIQTSGKLSLRTDGAMSWFSMRHMDQPSAGRLVSEQINVAMILEAFQYVLGLSWTPIELHITSSNGYWLKDMLPSFDFKLKTNCREIAVGFRTSELAARNRFYEPVVKPQDLDLDNIDKVADLVFLGMDGNYLPTLNEFSAYFGYSRRTLIREFKRAGTSYRQMIDRHLFMRSLELMNDHTLSINEMSHHLGYAHTSNFIRAFRSWTGTTPNQFRLQAFGLK